MIGGLPNLSGISSILSPFSDVRILSISCKFSVAIDLCSSSPVKGSSVLDIEISIKYF